MIWKLVNNAGGRGFVFAVGAFVATTAMLAFNLIDSALWVEYNKAALYVFFGAKAIEGGAKSIAGAKGGGGVG